MNIVFKEKYIKYTPDSLEHHNNIPDWVWERRNFIWKNYDKQPIIMDYLGWMDVIPYKISKSIGEYIELKLRNHKKISILDVGCGCGGSLIGLAKKCTAPVFEVYGVEVSDS
jgi:ubiquinone/menaquinone biosynthesis C-methylase UbiE